MKKKVLAAIMAAAVILTGCGGGGGDDSPIQTMTPVILDETPEPTPDATKEPEGESESGQEPEEEENHEGMYRSEITNEWIDESLKDQRPIAVIVDNEKTALDHYGLTEADVVYEIMNSTLNGRITRLMAIVKDWGKIEQMGSIRSARPTNFALAAEWNAVVCHDGGPFYIDEWVAREYTNNLSGIFGRVKNGKNWEFTEYILAGDLEKGFREKGYSTEYNKHYPGEHFTFSDTEIDLSDEAGAMDCTEIRLPFPHNDSTLIYDEDTGTYKYQEYGMAHIDPLHDNAQLSFKNLLIQNCTFSQLDENGYMIYNTIDTSRRSGYYITNGKAIEVTWSKSSETAVTTFYKKGTGEEIQLNTGKTYISLVPSDTWNDIVMN